MNGFNVTVCHTLESNVSSDVQILRSRLINFWAILYVRQITSTSEVLVFNPALELSTGQKILL